eukprot:SAG31_NODE_11434_length_1031_cov_0.837983_2_plen_82_part_01
MASRQRGARKRGCLPAFYTCPECGTEQEAEEAEAANWGLAGRCPHCPPEAAAAAAERQRQEQRRATERRRAADKLRAEKVRE